MPYTWYFSDFKALKLVKFSSYVVKLVSNSKVLILYKFVNLSVLKICVYNGRHMYQLISLPPNLNFYKFLNGVINFSTSYLNYTLPKNLYFLYFLLYSSVKILTSRSVTTLKRSAISLLWIIIKSKTILAFYIFSSISLPSFLTNLVSLAIESLAISMSSTFKVLSKLSKIHWLMSIANISYLS